MVEVCHHRVTFPVPSRTAHESSRLLSQREGPDISKRIEKYVATIDTLELLLVDKVPVNSIAGRKETRPAMLPVAHEPEPTAVVHAW